jgi:hypothetical protein
LQEQTKHIAKDIKTFRRKRYLGGLPHYSENNYCRYHQKHVPINRISDVKALCILMKMEDCFLGDQHGLTNAKSKTIYYNGKDNNFSTYKIKELLPCLYGEHLSVRRTAKGEKTCYSCRGREKTDICGSTEIFQNIIWFSYGGINGLTKINTSHPN